jgi:hypothetical protein
MLKFLYSLILSAFTRQDQLAEVVADEFNKQKTTIQVVEANATQKIDTATSSLNDKIATSSNELKTLVTVSENGLLKAVAATAQTEQEHYTELSRRINSVQASSETPIKAVLYVKNDEGDIADVFTRTMAAQNKTVGAGQYKLEIVTDGGTIAYTDSEGKQATELTAGDSFLIDVDAYGNITNTSFANSTVSNKLADLQSQLDAQPDAPAIADIKTIFLDRLK